MDKTKEDIKQLEQALTDTSIQVSVDGLTTISKSNADIERQLREKRMRDPVSQATGRVRPRISRIILE